jgi:hypothetical protein
MREARLGTLSGARTQSYAVYRYPGMSEFGETRARLGEECSGGWDSRTMVGLEECNHSLGISPNIGPRQGYIICLRGRVSRGYSPTMEIPRSSLVSRDYCKLARLFFTFHAFRFGVVGIEIQIEPRPADSSWGSFSSLLWLDYKILALALSNVLRSLAKTQPCLRREGPSLSAAAPWLRKTNCLFTDRDLVYDLGRRSISALSPGVF